MPSTTTARSSRDRKQMKQPANPLREARNQLERAEQLRQSGKLVQAQKLCEEVLKRHPDYVGMLHTLGLVHADKRDYAKSLPHLVQAAMLNPHDWKTLTVLSGVYLRLGAREMAARTLEQAQQIQPQDGNIRATLGEIYRDDREYEAAADAYRKALELNPSLHEVQSGLGHCCTHLGRHEEAAKAFSNLAKHHPGSINMLYSLSQLPSHLIDVDLLSLLDKAVLEPSQERGHFESSVAFTRASALHTLKRYDEAWTPLLDANRLVFPEHEKTVEIDTKIQNIVLDGVKQNAGVMKGPEAENDGIPISLFVLGPSRSGKTTTEFLISSIAGVKRGYENRILENAVRHTFQTAGLPTRDWIVELPPALDEMCRNFYLKELEQRAGTANVFTNTHPGHITSVLRIASVLPNARFVFVKRNLDDVILRIFMKKYREGNSYAYNLAATRDYVTWYYEMIDALAEKLPHISTVVQYEDMIVDPAGALKAAADLCDLDLSDVTVPTLGDDRGCSDPYRDLIAAELSN